MVVKATADVIGVRAGVRSTRPRTGFDPELKPEVADRFS
jgi:hypothetical protein